MEKGRNKIAPLDKRPQQVAPKETGPVATPMWAKVSSSIT